MAKRSIRDDDQTNAPDVRAQLITVGPDEFRHAIDVIRLEKAQGPPAAEPLRTAA